MAPRGSCIVNDRRVFGIEPRAPARDVQVRLAERDQRLASDTRGVTERWLGDPEPTRSALAQRAPQKATNDVIEQRIRALKTKTRR